MKPFDRNRQETKKPLKNFLAPRTNFMLLHFLLSQQLNSLPFVVMPHPFHISRWSQAICQKLVQNKFAGTVRMKYKLKPARPRGKEGTCLFLKQSLCIIAYASVLLPSAATLPVCLWCVVKPAPVRYDDPVPVPVPAAKPRAN